MCKCEKQYLEGFAAEDESWGCLGYRAVILSPR